MPPLLTAKPRSKLALKGNIKEVVKALRQCVQVRKGLHHIKTSTLALHQDDFTGQLGESSRPFLLGGCHLLFFCRGLIHLLLGRLTTQETS